MTAICAPVALMRKKHKIGNGLPDVFGQAVGGENVIGGDIFPDFI